MTPTTAARILRNHSAWRRRLNNRPCRPKDILEAIAVVCGLVERENRLAFRRLSGEHDRKGRTARLTRHRAKAKAGRKVWAKYVSSSGELVPEVITTKLVLAAPPDISVISGVEIRRPRAGKVRAK